MHKIILLITLLSFTANAAESTKDLDVKNLTDRQIHFKVFELMRFSKYQETLEFCNDVLKQKPYNSEAHFGKGRALVKLKK